MKITESDYEQIKIEWSSDDRFHTVFIYPDEANRCQKKFSDLMKRKKISSDLRHLYKDLIRLGLKRYYKFQEKLINQPRKDAQKYIGDKIIRQKVFDKYGEICLRCGSKNNITIDHVIPIYLGGENIFENLQPLCRSCNSWKSTKIIDYRNE